MKKDRISIRFTPYQKQVLDELCAAFDTNCSMLVRVIVGDFLDRNEERLYEIINKRLKES